MVDGQEQELGKKSATEEYHAMITIGESLESANYEIAQVSRPGPMLKYIKVSITTCHWQGGRFNKMDTYHILPCVFLV